MTISRKERRMLLVLCIVAACAAYWMFIFTPVRAHAALLTEETEAARISVERNALGDVRLNPLRGETADAEARLSAAYPGLSGGRDQAAWTRTVEGLCTDGARLVALRFMEDAAQGVIGVQTAQLEARTGQSRVSAFIDSIAACESLMSVTRLDVTLEEDGQCLIRATLSIPYMAPDGK